MNHNIFYRVKTVEELNADPSVTLDAGTWFGTYANMPISMHKDLLELKKFKVPKSSIVGGWYIAEWMVTRIKNKRW